MSRWTDENGNSFDTGDSDHGWTDRSAMQGRYALAKVVKHDDRHGYNPPAVIAPAIDQEQFNYDMNREVELAVLSNPGVMAHRITVQAQQIADQAKRLDELERLIKQTKELNNETRIIVDP